MLVDAHGPCQLPGSGDAGERRCSSLLYTHRAGFRRCRKETVGTMRVDTIDASLAPGMAQDSSAPATTISIIQFDPEDSLDLLLAGVQKQTGPVIFLLPEHG